jgi:hypothetical protein
MNARTLITAGAIVALAAPAAATAKIIPVNQPATQVAKHLAKHKVTPRVLCICFPGPVTPVAAPMTEQEFEAQYDLDLIAHALDPVFGTVTTPQSATG